MAFDPNFNTSGGFKNPMNNDNPCSDFSDWYQNEESFDLTNFMSGSANLELCSDDLFQNLFPPTSPLNGPDLKKGNNIDFNDAEVENWYLNGPSEPTSACASACSSAAPSPLTVNYYNTPPVTPQAERQRPSSPHHLQFDGLTTPMSSSRFASLRVDEGRNMPLQHQNELALSNESTIVAVKEEPNQDASFLRAVPMSVKSEMHGLSNNNNLSSGGSGNPGTSFSSINETTKRSAPLDATVPSKKNKIPEKGTYEYIEKRKRNNIAVRRSRDKAKVRALETQKKVDELTSENEKLHKRVAELSHELATLKKLLQALPHMNP